MLHSDNLSVPEIPGVEQGDRVTLWHLSGGRCSTNPVCMTHISLLFGNHHSISLWINSLKKFEHWETSYIIDLWNE